MAAIVPLYKSASVIIAVRSSYCTITIFVAVIPDGHRWWLEAKDPRGRVTSRWSTTVRAKAAGWVNDMDDALNEGEGELVERNEILVTHARTQEAA